MRYLWAFGLALSLSLGGAVAAPAVVPPDQVLQHTADDMLFALRARPQYLRQHPEALRQLVESILVPHVDLELLARFVLGRHWREISESQQQRFTLGFKDMLIRFYATSMLEYLDYSVKFYPTAIHEGDKLAVVRSVFMHNGQKKIEVNYRVALRDGQWRAFDVTIDNVSIVTNYRASFDSVIRQQGMEALLSKIQTWNKRE